MMKGWKERQKENRGGGRREGGGRAEVEGAVR